MLHDSPLRSRHEDFARQDAGRSQVAAGADRPGAAVGKRISNEMIEYLPYGGSAEHGPACELAASVGAVEIEYAAIRRDAAMLDSPHRGTLLVTGDANERREFLNRMVTQDMKNLAAGQTKAAFWLNRKGRIESDLFLIELGDRMFIDVDIHQAASTVRTLSDFIVMEEVKIEDVSDQFHHLAIHGPRANEVIAAASGFADFQLSCGEAATITIADTPLTVARRDQTGEIGYELIIPYDNASMIWDALLPIQEPEFKIQDQFLRPIGWHAYNIARIEAGTPLFNIDFGQTNLPHETGLLHERVSFTKGCYLGQEVVARMENLGKPKQTLVGLRMQDDLLPIAGEQVFSRDDEGSMAEQVGVVTSSTLSPMLGAAPVAFAMIKAAAAKEGESVLVHAEGEPTHARISPLRFWSKTENHGDPATSPGR